MVRDNHSLCEHQFIPPNFPSDGNDYGDSNTAQSRTCTGATPSDRVLSEFQPLMSLDIPTEEQVPLSDVPKRHGEDDVSMFVKIIYLDKQ